MTIQLEAAAPFQDLIQNTLSQTAGDKIFLNSATGGSISYGKLASKSGKAISLYRHLNLARQSRILILSKQEGILTALLVAALLETHTTIVGDSDSVADEMILTLDAGKPDLVILDKDMLTPALTDKIKSMPCPCYLIDTGETGSADQPFEDLQSALKQQPQTTPQGSAQDSDIALIVFTSGTTSRPKGVQLTYGNLSAQLAMFSHVYQFDEASHILTLLPLHHVDGLIRGLLAPLTFGSKISRPQRFQINDLPDILSRIKLDGISHLILVPTLLALIDRTDSPFDDVFRGPAFQFIICSADHLPLELWQRFEQRFGTKVVNAYGLSETVCDSLFCGPAAELRKIGTLGKPVGCEIRLTGSDGSVVPAGVTGEINLRGPHITSGYFQQPEETQTALKDGWFATGDLASLDDDGFYHFEGRKKNIIVTGGINIHPENINRVLVQHEKIIEAATFGRADDLWGQVAVSCIVLSAPDNAAETVTETDIMAYCRDHLPAEKTPHHIIFVTEIPKVASGKTDLTALQALVATSSQPGTSANYNAAPDVFVIAASCFKVPMEDLSAVSTPYNTKGWDSLAHLSFISLLEEAFAMELSPFDIINLNSLEDACIMVGQTVE